MGQVCLKEVAIIVFFQYSYRKDIHGKRKSEKSKNNVKLHRFFSEPEQQESYKGMQLALKSEQMGHNN